MASFKHIRAWQLVIVAAIMTCGAFLAGLCFAKMTAETESGNGSLSVAKWDVQADGSGEGISLTAGSGVGGVYTLTVTNNSEVASDYVIELSNVPDGVSAKLDDGALKTPTGGVIVFGDNDPLILVNGSREKEHTLHFEAALNTGAIENGLL